MKSTNASGDLVVHGYRFKRHAGDKKAKINEIENGGKVSRPRFSFWGREILTEPAIRERVDLLIRSGKLKPAES